MHQQIKQLMLGNGLAQVLQFGSILILSRIYAPSDFGHLAQVQSIAMVGAIWITLQLHLTIPLQKKVEDAERALKIIEKIAFSIFIITIIPAIIAGNLFIFALSLSLFLGLANTYNGYLIYRGEFNKLSVFYVVRALMIIGMQISSATLNIDNGLIFSTILGEILATIYLWAKKNTKINRIKITYREIIKYIKQNKSFAFHGSLQESVSVIAFYMPLFIFSIKYGEEVAGQYAMASRLTWAPIVLISSSIANVMSHFYGKDFEGEIKTIRKYYNAKFISAIILIIILGFILQPIMHFAIGKTWELASEIISLQIVWGMVFIASTPLRVACRVMKLQRYQLLADGSSLVMISVIILSLNYSPIQSMLVIAIISIIQHIIFSIIIYAKSLRYIKNNNSEIGYEN